MRNTMVVAGVILALCASGAWAHVHLTQDDLVYATSLQVGQALELTLKENPTTGYRWVLTCRPPELVKIARNDYKTDGEAIPGRGGTRYFTLQGAETGTALATLQYERSRQDRDLARSEFLPLLVTPAVTGDQAPVQAGTHGAVSLDLNEFLAVTLKANPSTGYGWTVQCDPPEAMRLVSTHYRADSNLLGAPGTVRMLFQPKSAGLCAISLRYARANGEGDAPLYTMVRVFGPGG